jgi:riboflavin kinase/FMN adenylyltransferase
MAVAIGVFDGVHVAHRAVIRNLRAQAASRGLVSGVLTFQTHPAATVRPDATPKLLTDFESKMRFLAATGIERALVLQFDREHSQEGPEAFVDRVLVTGLNARLVVVGQNFRFGRDRAGDFETLIRLGADRGFDVQALELVRSADGHERSTVSSTLIRAALAEGEVEEAHRLLGRPHELSGQVEHGDERGRTWGFPTANVAVADGLAIPARGIYAGWAGPSDDQLEPAAIYVGNRPTVYGDHGSEVLEVHLLDWSGDLYGRRVTVRFTDRIRGDQRFDSFDQLVEQIRRDCDRARELLSASR